MFFNYMLSFSGTLECVCGMGCRRDFPFQSRNECEIQLNGESEGLSTKINLSCFSIAGSRGADVCSTAPCSHGGQCIQLKYGGYRCDCTGTGYHGQYCSKSKYSQNTDRGGAIF